jgi:hypothetical protein
MNFSIIIPVYNRVAEVDGMQTVHQLLQTDPADCFGVPDMEHASFNTIQRAVNYSMTSFLTTGGIRGGKINLEIAALLFSMRLLLLPAAYLVMIFGNAMRKTRSLTIAACATFTLGIQIIGYGIGFIKATVEKIVLGKQLECIETINRKYK